MHAPELIQGLGNMGNKAGIHLFDTILFLAVVIGAIVFSIFSSSLATEGYGLNIQPVTVLDDGWTVSYGDVRHTDLSLPLTLDLPAGTPVTIEREITDFFLDNRVMRIRSSMMDLLVTIGSKEIYRSQVTPQEGWFHDPYPSTWHFVHIQGNDIIGKTLRVTFTSPTNEFSGYMPSIAFGTGIPLLLSLISSNLVTIIASIVLFVFGLLFIALMPWLYRLGADRRFLYIGIFLVSIGIWILSESNILQYIVPNRFILGSTTYIMNLIMPIIIALYTRDIILIGFRKTVNSFIYGMFALIFLELALQVLGIFTYISMTRVSLITIGLFAFTFMGILRYESKKLNNGDAADFLRFFLHFFGLLLILIVMFAVGLYHDFGYVLAIGSLFLFIILFRRSYAYIAGLLAAKNEAVIFRELASTDHLTKGPNRSAFDEDVDRLLERGLPFRLALLDMNDLKGINDTLGHTEGDHAIIDAYTSIADVCGVKGKAYRISGDEFSVILEDTDETLWGSMSLQLANRLRTRSVDTPYDLSIAVGSAVFEARGYHEFKEFYREVDQMMYEHKQGMKDSSQG